MAMSYLFQFLDKSALGFTAILTLREDLHLSGLDYSWAGGIYYVGYLVASYPAAWLLVSDTARHHNLSLMFTRD